MTDRNDGEGDFVYLGCLRARGLVRVLYSGSFYGGYLGDEAFGFRTSGPYVAFQTLSNHDHYGTSPTLFDVVGFDLARGRMLFDDQAGYADEIAVSRPPVKNTAFAVDALVIGPTGAIAWLSHTTSFTTTVTTTTSTRTTTGGTITTTSSTTTVSGSVTTYAITVHDRRGRRLLDSAVKTGAAPPLSALRISRQAVTWLHDGQPRSAAAG